MPLAQSMPWSFPFAPKLFVLDMAGTTVDGTFEVHKHLIAAFQSQHFNIDQRMASLSIAVPKPIGIARILDTYFSIKDPELTEAIHVVFLHEINRYYATDASVREMEGSTLLFEYLRKNGIAVYLDTGFSRATADIIIHRLHWSKLLNGSICSDEVSNGRPDPEMIYWAMKQLGVQDASTVVKVGDTPADILQGKAAGCGAILGINSGTFTKEELIDAGADLVVQHPGDILQLMKACYG